MRVFVSENTNTITVITYRNSAFPQLNVVFDYRNVSQIKILKKIFPLIILCYFVKNLQKT